MLTKPQHALLSAFLGTLLISVFFFFHLQELAAAGVTDASVLIRIAVVAVILIVVFEIACQVLLNLTLRATRSEDADEPMGEDERDRQIERQSTAYAYAVTVFGLVFTLGHLVFGDWVVPESEALFRHSNLLTASLLLGTVLLAELVKRGSALWLYWFGEQRW